MYDPATSSTAVDLHQNFTAGFGDGSSVVADVFLDTVTIAGLTALKQGIGAATTYSDSFALDVSPPDGLAGFAFQSIAESGQPVLFQTLVEQGQATKPVFGFTLLDNGGELFLGGTDERSLTGKLFFTPLTVTNPPGFWEINTGDVTVGGKTVVKGPQDAIVDTGTTLITVDMDSANAIFAQVNGSKPADPSVLGGPGFFTVPCDNVPSDIALSLAGRSFTLSPDSLNLGPVTQGSSDCVAGISGTAGTGKGIHSCWLWYVHTHVHATGFWIVGDVMLRNLYTREHRFHHVDRVGEAQSFP